MSIQTLLQANADRRQKLIAEARRLADIFYALGALDVWIFGSVANDSVISSSDLDLAVVLLAPEGGDAPGTRFQQARSLVAAAEPTVPLDLLIVRPGAVEKAIQHGDLMWQNARRVTLH